MNRFLKSRVLPILTILILFSGWVLIAGYLLWQVKVKEEFPCLGKLVSYSEGEVSVKSGEERIKLILLQGLNQKALKSLVSGQEVDLTVEKQPGRKEQLQTTFLGFEKQGSEEAMVLGLQKGSQGRGRSEVELLDSAQPVRLSLGIRQKSLLGAAFERHPLLR